MRASPFLYADGCPCEVLECEIKNMRLDNENKEKKKKKKIF